MKILLALILGIVGFQQPGQKVPLKQWHPNLNADGSGPAGTPVRAKPQPKFHNFEEPAWSFSKLEQTRDDFRKIRLSLESELGPIISENFIGMSRAQAAYTDYLKGKRQTDAFRALYLSAEANSGEFGKYDSLWAVLPKDEYEVARLHFIVGSGSASNDLAPMGDRLLAKNGKDLNVLYVQSFLRSMFKPDQDLGKAKQYALVALKEKPCASTYLGYATVNVYLAKDGKQRQATPVAKTYLNKYLAVANSKDIWRHYLVEMCRRWIKSQGQ